MSGTSADGIDVALLEITQTNALLNWKLLGFESFPHTENLRKRILQVTGANLREIAELDRAIAESFADASIRFCEQHQFSIQKVDFIASHGQTVYHHSGQEPKCSLQLGNGDYIAEKTGSLVISDFRPRDIAAGGEGAPLSAYGDYLLFASVEKPLAVLNLGGIANLSFLNKDPEALLAFDVGPANMLLDGLVRRVSRGEIHFDRDGKLAKSGKVDTDLLAWMMEHPFLKKAPPKSTGREDFGEHFLAELLSKKNKVSLEDLLASAIKFSAKAIRHAIEQTNSKEKIRELVVAGGGVYNPALMDAIRHEMLPITVKSSQDYGIPVQARESMIFALLGHETLRGNTANHPGATGAKRRVPLGRISL